jgi:hypothetical protein
MCNSRLLQQTLKQFFFRVNQKKIAQLLFEKNAINCLSQIGACEIDSCSAFDINLELEPAFGTNENH